MKIKRITNPPDLLPLDMLIEVSPGEKRYVIDETICKRLHFASLAHEIQFDLEGLPHATVRVHRQVTSGRLRGEMRIGSNKDHWPRHHLYPRIYADVLAVAGKNCEHSREIPGCTIIAIRRSEEQSIVVHFYLASPANGTDLLGLLPTLRTLIVRHVADVLTAVAQGPTQRHP
jgi:hypothetical protein